MNFVITILLIFLSACSVQSKTKSVEGKVSITSNLANKIGPSDVLYILAYPVTNNNTDPKAKPESQPSQNPLAVHKIAPVILPTKYSLSQEDIIFPEKKFEGNLNVMARLQKNPESTPAQRGEYEGWAKKNPVKPGDKNVDILLVSP